MEISDLEILDAMQKWGGGFVSAFAKAYRVADDDNRRLLKPVFDKYRESYRQAAEIDVSRRNAARAAK